MRTCEYKKRRRQHLAWSLLAVSFLVVPVGFATSAFSQGITCAARAASTPQVPLLPSVPIGAIDLTCMDPLSGSGGPLTLQIGLSTGAGLSSPSAILTGASGSMTVTGTKAAPNAYVFHFTNVVRPIRTISVSNLSANTLQLAPKIPIQVGLSLTGTLVNNSPIIVGIVQPSCFLSVSPASILIPAVGGSGKVQVGSTTGCIDQSWIPSSDQSWLVVSGSGSGTGFFTWTATANPSNSPRAGTVKVASQTIVVSQPSSAPITCTANAGSIPSVPIGSSTAVGNIQAICTDSGSGSGGSLTLAVTLSTDYGLMTPTAIVRAGNRSLEVAGTRTGYNVYSFTIPNMERPLQSISIANLTADTRKIAGAGTVLAELEIAASFGNIQVVNPQITLARLGSLSISPSSPLPILVPPGGGNVFPR